MHYWPLDMGRRLSNFDGKEMITLKDAQKDPKKLQQFIKEREQSSACGDKKKFTHTLSSMSAGKKSKDR